MSDDYQNFEIKLDGFKEHANLRQLLMMQKQGSTDIHKW